MKLALAVNALAFQCAWLGFVAGAADGRPWIGFLVLAPFAAYTVATSPHRRADLELAAIAALLGFAIDSALAWSGLVSYRAPVPSSAAAPPWIVGLWVAFALTLNHSLGFLKSRPRTAATFGAIGGPVSYAVAAWAWGAIAFAPPAWLGLAALGLAWAIAMPTLAVLAHVLCGRERPRAVPYA